MNEYYSASELSKALGYTPRAVRKRANLEKWKSITGKPGHFPFQSLPEDVKREIVSKEAGCAVDFVPSKKISVQHAEACLKKWNKASKSNKKIAQARDSILNELSEFIEAKSLNKGLGQERFASFYNAGLVKELAPWIIDKIPSVSAPTLRRWSQDREKNGLAGLLGGHGKQKGKYRAIHSEMSAFIIANIKAKPHIRPEYIFKMICKMFDEHPSRRTVYRFINNWNQENPQLFALIEDPRRWKNCFMPAFGDASADVPHAGHTWEIDSTPADIVTKDGQRLAMIVVVDVFTRRMLIHIAATSKSIAIAALIRKAMLLWGIPVRIRMDNGADYQSHDTRAIMSAFKIETPPLPINAPERKPFVERGCGTISIIQELLPGFLGHSVPEQQARREREAWGSKIIKPGKVVEIPLTMEEFQDVADRAAKILANSPHGGLGGKTPLEVAKESRLQPQKIRNERVLDILLAPVGNRKVGKKGVSIDNSYFVSPELIEYIGKRVEIRRDLNNAGLLYVFDASTGKYLCQAKNEPLEGHGLEAYLEAKKQHSKELKATCRALDQLSKSSRTPVEILLGDQIEYDESNVIPFQSTFENQAVKEAGKAVADFDIKQIDEAPDQVAQAVNYYPTSDYILNNSSHMTVEDLDKEIEELKKHCNKKLI